MKKQSEQKNKVSGKIVRTIKKKFQNTLTVGLKEGQGKSVKDLLGSR